MASYIESHLTNGIKGHLPGVTSVPGVKDQCEQNTRKENTNPTESRLKPSLSFSLWLCWVLNTCSFVKSQLSKLWGSDPSVIVLLILIRVDCFLHDSDGRKFWKYQIGDLLYKKKKVKEWHGFKKTDLGVLETDQVRWTPSNSSKYLGCARFLEKNLSQRQFRSYPEALVKLCNQSVST